MTHLNRFVAPHTDEYPGANFRAFDDIPAAECETPAGITNVSQLAALARVNGKAYTFASGCIYSDLDVPEMQTHCSVAYNPQIDAPLHPL